jgi:hypothetical protein
MVTITAWEPLAPATREAVEAEAVALPLPDLGRPISIRWES